MNEDLVSEFSAAIDDNDLDRLCELVLSNSLAGDFDLGEWVALSAMLGRLDCLRLLLDCDADVNWQNEAGETAFSYACSRDQFECAKLLHAYGADINRVHESGAKPLDIAACHARPEFREWLKEAGGVRAMAFDEWPWPPPN